MTPVAATDRTVRPGDRWLYVLAIGFGTGLFPKGPGTCGSLLGPPLIGLLSLHAERPWLAIAVGVILFLIGVPICDAGIRVLGVKDPKQVVFDEIAAFCWVYLFTPWSWELAVSGFLLFRIFDILKPWPVRRVELLPRGWGVMADDAVAGMMAGVSLAALWWVVQ